MFPNRPPQRSRLGEAGFTWSEFTLVVGLIVLLLGLASWGVNGIRDDTRDSFCQSSLRSLKLAVGEYQAGTDRLPVDNKALIDLGYAAADDIRGHRVTVNPGDTEATYVAHGRCA